MHVIIQNMNSVVSFANQPHVSFCLFVSIQQITDEKNACVGHINLKTIFPDFVVKIAL